MSLSQAEAHDFSKSNCKLVHEIIVFTQKEIDIHLKEMWNKQIRH